MSRPLKITEDRLIDEAIAIIEQDGLAELTIGALAHALDVKPPSLYNHVTGIDAVRLQVGVAAISRLGDVLADAVMGRAGSDALFALCHAYRTFAASSPELYAVALSATAGTDDEFDSHAWRAHRPLYRVLSAHGLEDAEMIHTARMIRAALHGFVTLEHSGQFGLPESVDASFDELVDWLTGLLDD